MEKKIINKTNQFINEMKDKIIKELNKDNFDSQNIVTFIDNYPSIQFNKEDFIKRKRIKNIVPNLQPLFEEADDMETNETWSVAFEKKFRR